ncbi:MAG TPA: response regulator [Anaerolineales bacterium]|jgi:pilus assembly protein CpaE|nr:response regulator [Anaerolineales bacterium]
MAEAEKITVIIVDDIAETRENIHKLLQFEPNIAVIGSARTGEEAIRATADLRPDVVLMDINMPDMDGITATERIRARVPGTQVVILSVQNDSNYMRKAMLAGARDFLTKPPDLDELISAIVRAGEMAHEEKKKAATTLAAVQASGGISTSGGMLFPARHNGRVLTIYGPKGGTGSTTLTTNLAVALHTPEKPVVVVDGRLQFGDLSFFFNEQTKNNLADVATRADELDPDFIEEVLLEHESGVKIMAAPPRPEQAESVTGDQFSRVVRFLKKMFAYVLIDTNSGLDEITLTAIDEADLISVVTTQDIPSIKNVRLFLDLLIALGYQREKVFLVMNMFDKRRSVTAERVSEITKCEVVAVLPFDDRLVVPAMDRGVPFITQNKTHPISKGIVELAEGVNQKIAAIEKAEEEVI